MNDNNLFGENEMKVIEILDKYESLTIKELTKLFYKDDRPYRANNRVAGFVRQIAEKCEFFDLDWTIKGKGGGRAGRTVWIEEKI